MPASALMLGRGLLLSAQFAPAVFSFMFPYWSFQASHSETACFWRISPREETQVLVLSLLSSNSSVIHSPLDAFYTVQPSFGTVMNLLLSSFCGNITILHKRDRDLWLKVLSSTPRVAIVPSLPWLEIFRNISGTFLWTVLFGLAGWLPFLALLKGNFLKGFGLDIGGRHYPVESKTWAGNHNTAN